MFPMVNLNHEVDIGWIKRAPIRGFMLVAFTHRVKGFVPVWCSQRPGGLL
jgi:hypothetical protein